MIFNCDSLDSQQKYRLLNGGVTPRPIAWISTQSKDEIDNLAPYSFFTVASCNPPVLLFNQITQRSGLNKNTLQNLIDTKECVVNIVTTESLEKMNKSSASLPSEESEFEFAGIEKCSSHKVTPFSVKASPIRYECTLREIVAVGDQLMGGKIVLLDVQSIVIRDDLLSEGSINQVEMDTVGRLGGEFFAVDSKKVTLVRP